MKMPPDITQLIKTLKREKADYIPIAELGIHPKIKEKFLDRPITNLKDDVEFCYKAGYDYIKLQPVFNFEAISSNQSFADEKTDAVRKWAPGDVGLIQTTEDLEKVKFPATHEIDYSRFDEVKKYLPEGMGVIGQYGDIFTMTWEMMGFETFSLALFENPELVVALNKKIGNLVLSMFESFAQNDAVDIIWYSDDIAYQTGLMISPVYLDKYFFPWLKKIGELAKRYSKPFIYHTDGILYSVMDKIIDCGVDALHPIEPKAMHIAEVKEKYGNKLSLIGNIDVDLLARGTKEEVRQNVLHNIESAGTKGGYCVGSGNSIPDYVKYENYLTMINTVKEFNQKNNLRG